MRSIKLALVVACALAAALPGAYAAKPTKKQLAQQITRDAARAFPTSIDDRSIQSRVSGQYLRVTEDCKIEIGRKEEMLMVSGGAYWNTKQTASLDMVRIGGIVKSDTVWKATLHRPDFTEVVRSVQILPNGQEKVAMFGTAAFYVVPGSKLLDDLNAMADLCGAPAH